MIFFKKKFNPDSIIIHTHLGLGDHIICNGLVRELIPTLSEKNVFLPAKLHNAPSVSWMYKDLINLFVVPINNDSEARSLTNVYKCKYEFISCDASESLAFDEAFYRKKQINFECRWTSFFCEPGPNSKNLFIKLNPLNVPYRLVHDESSIGKYPLNLPNDGLLTIRVQPLTNNLLDWCDLIRGASEIHAIDSSFIHLVESLRFGDNGHRYYYHTIKPDPGFSRRLNWATIHY